MKKLTVFMALGLLLATSNAFAGRPSAREINNVGRVNMTDPKMTEDSTKEVCKYAQDGQRTASQFNTAGAAAVEGTHRNGGRVE